MNYIFENNNNKHQMIKLNNNDKDNYRDGNNDIDESCQEIIDHINAK